MRFVVTDGTTSMTVVDTGGVPALFRAAQGVVAEGVVRAPTACSTRTRPGQARRRRTRRRQPGRDADGGEPGRDAADVDRLGTFALAGVAGARRLRRWSPRWSAPAGTRAAGRERPHHRVLAVRAGRRGERRDARGDPGERLRDRLRGRELQPRDADVLQGPVAVVERRGLAAAVEPDPRRVHRRGGVPVPAAPAGDAAVGAGGAVRRAAVLPGPGDGADAAVRDARGRAAGRAGAVTAAAEPSADGGPSADAVPGVHRARRCRSRSPWRR